MKGNFLEKGYEKVYGRRQLELSRRGDVTCVQGIEPAIGITDHGVDAVIL